jgi:hypothetical protein
MQMQVQMLMQVLMQMLMQTQMRMQRRTQMQIGADAHVSDVNGRREMTAASRNRNRQKQPLEFETFRTNIRAEPAKTALREGPKTKGKLRENVELQRSDQPKKFLEF